MATTIVNSIIVKLADNEFCAQKVDFFDRILKNFKGVWIFYIIILLGAILITSIVYGLLIFLVLLVWHIVEYYSWSKYHLTHILLSAGKLKIEYLKGDSSMSVEDEKEKFLFEKKAVSYKKIKTIYLVIRYNDKVLLKQYPIADIDEGLFDSLIERF